MRREGKVDAVYPRASLGAQPRDEMAHVVDDGARPGFDRRRRGEACGGAAQPRAEEKRVAQSASPRGKAKRQCAGSAGAWRGGAAARLRPCAASFMLTLSIRRPAICACPTPTCQAVILVSNRNVYVLIFTSGARFSHRRREVRVSLT